jgi:putative membrane-bound dehydrogenase-like protein
MAPFLRLLFVAVAVTFAIPSGLAAPVLKVLFLGDNGHHQPAARLRQLGPVMMDRGVQVVYTEDLAALTEENLRRYDALLVYANIDQITPDQEKAVLGYVRQGGGLAALHCASFCFRNSDAYIALVGAQFKSHGTGTFRTRLLQPEHPVTQGFNGFESWDETYVHHRHNPDGRTVLEQRDEEPWTWIRTEGKGRIFYTAWGHDDRTWSNPGFHDLVERGLRYAAGQSVPEALAQRPLVPRLERFDQSGIPYYAPGQRSQGDGVWAQMQKPLTPADSMKRLVVPAGFEVQLVASEPDIRKPIAMAWDERGRLWLAETLDYPNQLLEPGQAGRDRLTICEDTDGDGRMDRFTVFADGLNIPTGFTFSQGGVVLLQAPHTLFLKDTDGDDRADVREILFTGWGRSDTHAGPSNLVYGPDNWIWGVVGYAAFSGSVGGEAHAFRQGFFRFRPDGSKLEFLRGTNNNTWGLGFREDGIAFASTANNNPSVYLPIPQRSYANSGLEAKTLASIAETSRFLALTSRVRQVDVHWGYTAAAGHAFYTARSYPKSYWNRVAFVTEPTGHLVGNVQVDPSEGDFRAKNPDNLVVSDDEWFAPIMAEVGPDGAVWIIDWYNYIVQHNPTPKGFGRGPGNAYENSLRDQRYGRVYRIVWKGDATTKPAASFSLAGKTPSQWVTALGHENLLWRRHAQRLIVERGRKDIVPELVALTKDLGVDELGFNAGALHALWTLQGLNAVDAVPEALAAATEALRHPSAAVRRGALTVLPRTPATGAAVIKASMMADTDPQVRLAALLVLSEVPLNADIGKALYAHLDREDFSVDRWTAEAATLAAMRHHRGFLTAAKPARIERAKASMQETMARRVSPQAIPPVETFERSPIGAATDWKVATQGDGIEVAVTETGRASYRSLMLKTGAGGVDASVSRVFKVKRNTRYEVGGWIKTENVETRSNALGAFIQVPEINQPRRTLTIASKGTTNWASGRISFDSGEREEITVACVLGGGGLASGTAWFDDLVLNDMGPADDRVRDPLTTTLVHVLAQTTTRSAAADPDSDATIVQLGVIPDVMKYDRTELTARPGEKLKLIFRNTDHMQHNALVLRPGRIEAVGALADAMLTDPKALARHYVPESPDVLASTPLVNPGESFELVFAAPTSPGRYPIICTFPGHWRIMQSVLIIQ